MSRRQRHAGYGRDGLFEFDPADPDAIRDVPDNPLLRKCKRELGGCGASPGSRCTRPSRGGRVELKTTYHPARSTPEATHSPETPDPRVTTPDTPPTQAQRSTQEPT